MLLKNLSPNANKINAKTTFTELSQPPDFGNLLSAEGNNASKVKGAAKARPKKNIPIRGRIPPS